MEKNIKTKIIAFIARFLPRNDFVRNVATLMTGTVFAQALTIFISPVLTRLYSPGSFGIYTYYTSILGILSTIVCLKYDVAIVIPVDDEEAANLFFISILICGAISLLSFVVAFSLNSQIVFILKTPELSRWLLLLPVSILFAGLFQALNYWCTRKKKFKILAVRQITQSSTTSIIQIGTGVFGGSSPGGLIAANIIGQAIAVVRIGILLIKEDFCSFKRNMGRLSIKANIIKYRNYPFFEASSALVNSASTLLPPLLIGYFWGVQTVGYLALTTRILTLPMTIIGHNMAQVFFPQANEAMRNGSLDSITISAFQKLLEISVVPLVLVAIVGPHLFSFCFGSVWFVSGIYARWLVPWILFNFISSPISAIFPITSKQHLALLFNTIFLASRLVLIIFCGFSFEADMTIKLYGLLSGLFYFIFLCIIISLAKVSIWICIKMIFMQMIKAIPFCIIPILLLCFYNNNNMVVFLSGISMGLIFVFVTYRAYFLKELLKTEKRYIH